MDKIIHFEYCALIIEVLILMSVYLRNMTRGRVNRCYLAVVYTVTVGTITDIIGMVLEKIGPGYVLAKYIANLLNLASTACITVLLCGYLFAQSGIDHNIRNNKIIKYIFYVPVSINLFLLFVVNPFNKCIFYIDDAGIYARGDKIILLYVLSLVYVYIGASVVIQNRKIYPYRKAASVFLLLASSVIAAIIQAIFPNVIIQMFCTAVASLILLLQVQAPEEKIHAGTGLFGMYAYSQDIKNLFDNKARFSAVLCVISNFNAIIEMVGYFGALEMTKQAASRLLKYSKVNKLDIDIYYLSNGRFAIIADERYSSRMFEITQNINVVMNRVYDINDSEVIGMSNVCLINCPDDVDNPDFLIECEGKLADEAFSGEVRYADKLFSKRSYELRRDISSILDRAFAEGYFDLHYQPVFDSRVGKFVCAEAFLRLNDPDFGYIEPNLIISEAEKCGAIHAITAYVFEEVCKFLSQPDFLLTGLEFIEINLSPVQCMWGDLVTVVLATLRAYNVAPKRICLNITDIENYDLYARMKTNLEALSQIGFLLVMDDFGAGIFEIERIAELPLFGIKMDRDFIKRGLAEKNMTVLKGTVKMITDIGLDASAVGVEDEQMLEKLSEVGCKVLQGYHYCKPVNKKELMRFMLLD